MESPLIMRGVIVYRALLGRNEQEEIVADMREVVARAPLFSPLTPYGKPMSVRMTSAGRFGWFADRSGYRYIPTHPSGSAWPPIPGSVRKIWDAVAGTDRSPDCCLVNVYRDGARMGLHQDKDEASFDYPVVSVSLGDEALFRVGNLTRGGTTESIWLGSGDVVVIGGAARLVYHGVDRIRSGSSDLLDGGGRINLTLRVVD